MTPVEDHRLSLIVAPLNFPNSLQAQGISPASSEEQGGTPAASWKMSSIKVNDWGFLASVLHRGN